MINIKSIIGSDRGAIVMSVLLGFGISTLFRKACLNRSCIVFEAPSKEMLTNGIFKYDNKCYKNTPEHVKCSKTLKSVSFATPKLY